MRVAKPGDSIGQELGKAGPRSRRLEADGEIWIVREVPVPGYDRRGGTHLLFDGISVMRRVRRFPADWYDLSEADLYALSTDIRQP